MLPKRDAQIVNELFRQQILDKIVSVCLQFYGSDCAQTTGPGNTSGYVEGMAEMQVGLRVVHRVCKLMKRLLFEFRTSASAMSPHAEQFAMAVVRLYVGEADLLPAQAGANVKCKHESFWGAHLHEICQVSACFISKSQITTLFVCFSTLSLKPSLRRAEGTLGIRCCESSSEAVRAASLKTAISRPNTPYLCEQRHILPS